MGEASDSLAPLRGAAGVAVALLLAALALVEIDVARSLSITFDEESHIGAGFSYVAHRDVVLNQEHPPLVKLIAGTVIAALGVKETSAAELLAEARERPAEASRLSYGYGELLLFQDNPTFVFAGARPGADSIVTAARLPLVLFPVLLALVAYAWARTHFGTSGGLLALALVATYPDLLGHGALVTTDVPSAAFVLASGFALDRLVHDGRARWLVLLGLTLGGALAVKFSGVFLALGLALAAGVAAVLPSERDAEGPADPFGRARTGARLGALVLSCLVVGALALVIVAVSYLGHEPVSAYRLGVASIYTNASSTYRGLCLGRYEPRFWYYFLVAVALKAPLGTLALVLATLVAAVVTPRARAGARAELCLHVPALVLFVATSALAAPIGSRYVIPAVVFLFVSAGRLAVWAGTSSLRRLAIGLALVGNLLHVAHEHPFHASSVNALGGSPRSFYRLLDDSNQDWGQGLKALARWQRERGVPRITLLSNLLVDGSELLDAYGVEGEAIMWSTMPLFFPEPGKTYAVSAHILARGVLDETRKAAEFRSMYGRPIPLALGRRIEPSEVVGGGLLIFDLRATGRGVHEG